MKTYIITILLLIGITFGSVAAFAGIIYGKTKFMDDVSVGSWSAVAGITSSYSSVGSTYTNGNTNTFYYRMSGTNLLGRLPLSDVLTNSFVGSTNTNAVAISWTRKEGIKSYIIEKSFDNATWTNWRSFGPAYTNFTDTGAGSWTNSMFTNIYTTVIPSPTVPWVGTNAGLTTNTTFSGEVTGKWNNLTIDIPVSTNFVGGSNIIALTTGRTTTIHLDAVSYTNLSDTPSSYSLGAHALARVNGAGNAMEFVSGGQYYKTITASTGLVSSGSASTDGQTITFWHYDPSPQSSVVNTGAYVIQSILLDPEGLHHIEEMYSVNLDDLFFRESEVTNLIDESTLVRNDQNNTYSAGTTQNLASAVAYVANATVASNPAAYSQTVAGGAQTAGGDINFAETYSPTNMASLGFVTNASGFVVEMFSGVLNGTSGVYFTENGTNYWSLFTTNTTATEAYVDSSVSTATNQLAIDLTRTNYVLVKTFSDFGTTNGSGQIPLLASTDYEVNGIITATSQLLLTNSNIKIFGENFGADVLVNGTTNIMILAQDSSFVVDTLSFISSATNVFDISSSDATDTFTANDVNFLGCYGFGVISNMQFSSVSRFFCLNNLGPKWIEYQGTNIQKSYIFDGVLNSQTSVVTYLDLGSSVHRFFSVDRVQGFVPTNAVFLSGLTGSSNITAAGQGGVHASSFNYNDGTDIVDTNLFSGVSASDERWTFVANPLIRPSEITIGLAATNTATTTINTAGVYEVLANYYETPQTPQRFSATTNGLITFNHRAARLVNVNASLVAAPSSGTTIDLEFALAKNGTPSVYWKKAKDITASVPASITFFAQFELDTGDTLQLYGRNNDTTADLVCSDIHIIVTAAPASQ